ncbi:hypothetical protein B0T26DRAFT_775155 [Lasiosphaeria miniovina]|uniref:RRM domain-containing protein n=1 Tax=Lasiosphaeria miniovina TaxID=1954250 RepID=A0AA40AJW3_9PEZI|nr:uncharacterized protein B0T26DRAFT_775155 [Lasiosphaeria miniovina]KAK0717212.1 hypothetical protein B0T26DRAFT_775155 [Lasiosphaeria miniovina]
MRGTQRRRTASIPDVPAHIMVLRSRELNNLTSGPNYMPIASQALSPEYFPFIESFSLAYVPEYGVVKIRNIPFGANRQEMIACLGRNSKILSDTMEPVHIIVDRVNGKTLDVYVEFLTLKDALNAATRHHDAVKRGHYTRLRNRPVVLEVSTQAALMESLFPYARSVKWEGARPEIQDNPSKGANGTKDMSFQGFVTEEEMIMLVKHAEIPGRVGLLFFTMFYYAFVPFSKDSPQRIYECMISTLKKMPWYMTDHITIRQRHSIYDATYTLIEILQNSIRSLVNVDLLTPQLLRRLVTAAMLCPGFSVTQKDCIAALAILDAPTSKSFNQPEHADQWNHLLTLCPRLNIPTDLLDWYIAIIREETIMHAQEQADHSREMSAELTTFASAAHGYFGFLGREIGMPKGPAYDSMTLAQAAQLEISAMQRVILRALARRH